MMKILVSFNISMIFFIVLVIVGSKLDLVPDPADILGTAEKYANEIGALNTKTSSKENIGIEETFVLLTKEILTRRKGNNDNDDTKRGFTIKADDAEDPNKKKNCCGK